MGICQNGEELLLLRPLRTLLLFLEFFEAPKCGAVGAEREPGFFSHCFVLVLCAYCLSKYESCQCPKTANDKAEGAVTPGTASPVRFHLTAMLFLC
jgi:hypothetical protein